MTFCNRSFAVTGTLLVALAAPAITAQPAEAATVSNVRPVVTAPRLQHELLTPLQHRHDARRHLPRYRRRHLTVLPTAPSQPATTVLPVTSPAPADAVTSLANSVPVSVPVAQPVSIPPVVTVPSSDNPFAGKRLYVAASTDAGREADRVRSSDPARARGLDYIADQATGYWWGDWNSVSTLRADVATHAARATAGGTVPVYVVYNIMKRDGAGYSAGGAASLAAYKAWIDQFVSGLGAHRALVIVEPDAVNDLYNETGTTRTERVAALRYALSALKANGTAAYLDAGGPTIHAPEIAARLLNEVGMELAQGFSVNVSNFQSTPDDLAWGKAVSALVGHKHFVIDTGRNGNGAIPASQDAQYWCNPPGRALGHAPTTSTGQALVDAFLWVKQPGESDGQCRGFAAAGTFSADYAYSLYAAMAG